MNQDLIIQALKDACDEPNLRSQIIIKNSQLYIYVNYRPDFNLDHGWLTDTIQDAIANLTLDSIEGIWLYTRKLGELEPDWQTFIELPLEDDSDWFESEMFFEMDSTGDTSSGDTGLLLDTGMIHGKPLKQEEFNILSSEIDSVSEPATEVNNLARYCFVSNKKILTGDIIPPDLQIIHLVKFFDGLSERDRQKILPILEAYFNNNTVSDTENLPVTLKRWFKKITALNESNRPIAAIWLSRYCFNPSTTLQEFEAIAKKAAEASQVRSTEYRFASANAALNREAIDDLNEPKFKLPPIVKKSLIPVVWTFATIVLVFLGVYTNQDINTSGLPSWCENTIGSVDYCRLGVAMAGEDAIEESFENIFPLTIITESTANYGCQRYANVKAEAFGNLEPQNNPVVSSYGEKIFSNIYIAEAVQKKATAAENVRVACVYTTGAGERSPKLLASDLIPLDWPQVQYQPGATSNLAFGRYTNLINLGLNTIFCAIGIAIASRFNLGISVTNRSYIYLVALVLGLIQVIAFNLPVFNLLAGIILPIIAIIAIAPLIKSFQLNWHQGYSMVVTGILLIVAVQFLLYGISLKLINSFL